MSNAADVVMLELPDYQNLQLIKCLIGC